MSTSTTPEEATAPKPKVYPQSPDRNSPGARPPDLKASKPQPTAKEVKEAAERQRREEGARE